MWICSTPAINAGLSVSRVGGAAQTKIIKKLSGGVRIALAQYRELEAFSQFASDLDETTRKQLERGQRVMQVLKQPQYQPLSVGEMSVIWYAVNEGYVDKVALKKVVDFQTALLSFVRDRHKALLEQINKAPNFDDKTAAQIKAAVEEFVNTQSY